MDKKKQALRIKVKLMENGISQRRLAGELGVSEFHLSNIIAGRRKSEKFNNWMKENLGENFEGR